VLLPSSYDSTQTEAYCMEKEVLFVPHLLYFNHGLHCGSEHTVYWYSVIQEVTGGTKKICRHSWSLNYLSGSCFPLQPKCLGKTAELNVLVVFFAWINFISNLTFILLVGYLNLSVWFVKTWVLFQQKKQELWMKCTESCRKRDIEYAACLKNAVNL